MKEKYILEYTSDVVDEPIIYNLIKHYDVKVNILRAEISPGNEGSMLIELDCDAPGLERVYGYLTEHSIKMIPIAQSLMFRESECVDCGACTGVCFSGCLSIGAPDWKLAVDRNKCIACGLCVAACPLGLFSLKFGD